MQSPLHLCAPPPVPSLLSLVWAFDQHRERNYSHLARGRARYPGVRRSEWVTMLQEAGAMKEGAASASVLAAIEELVWWAIDLGFLAHRKRVRDSDYNAWAQPRSLRDLTHRLASEFLDTLPAAEAKRRRRLLRQARKNEAAAIAAAKHAAEVRKHRPVQALRWSNDHGRFVPVADPGPSPDCSLPTPPSPPMRAYPGISINDAARLIRSDWRQLRSLPQQPPHDPDSGVISFAEIASDPEVVSANLRQTMRDCAWCVFHAHGNPGLHELHDHAIEGLDWEEEGHDLSRMMDFAFTGIGTWEA